MANHNHKRPTLHQVAKRAHKIQQDAEEAMYIATSGSTYGMPDDVVELSNQMVMATIQGTADVEIGRLISCENGWTMEQVRRKMHSLYSTANGPS